PLDIARVDSRRRGADPEPAGARLAASARRGGATFMPADVGFRASPGPGSAGCPPAPSNRRRTFAEDSCARGWNSAGTLFGTRPADRRARKQLLSFTNPRALAGRPAVVPEDCPGADGCRLDGLAAAGWTVLCLRLLSADPAGSQVLAQAICQVIGHGSIRGN